MTKFHRLSALIRAAAALAAILLPPASAHAEISLLQEDGNGYYGASWIGAGTGEMRLAWRPAITADGRVAVCGVWSLSNNTVLLGAEKILSQAVVRIDGRTSRQSLRRFARSPTLAGMSQTAPRCVATSFRGPWTEIAIEFGSGEFRD